MNVGIIEIDGVDKCNEVKTIISIIEEQYKRNYYTTNVTNLDKLEEICKDDGKISLTAKNLLKDIQYSVREIDNINAELENLTSEESKEQKCIIVSKIIDSFNDIRDKLEISRITTRNANT